MNNSLSADLLPFQDIIHALAPLVNHANFNTAFKERTHEVANDIKFLLKMEIKRLAKPCIRSIDLRQKISSDCSLFTFEGIPHYLHVNGILTFEKLVERYGEYTFGVYEGVLERALEEQQRIEQVKKQPALPSSTEIEIPEQKYITPCQDLLNYPTRKEERLNYVTDIEIFFADNSSATATTLDISISGLKVRFKDPKSLHSLRVAAPITIVFRGLDKSSGINKQAIEYEVLGLSGQGPKTNIHMRRTSVESNLDFNHFVNELVNQQKRRYKVNLDNVEMALSSKIYEQSFTNSNSSLPVFLGEGSNGKLSALYASYNGCSKRITDYWLNEKYQQMLGYLLNEDRIKRLMAKSEAYPQTTAFCFHHIANEKIYFYSALLEELEEQPKLAETFLAYGARRVSWRVYHLAYHDIDPYKAWQPTSLPDSVSKIVERKNRPLSPRLISKLQSIKAMVSITDVTDSYSQAVYQRRKLDKASIRLLKFFGHARNKPPPPIDIYRHKQEDLRRQTRYTLRTKVIVTVNKTEIHGFTEDFSISGLRLQLEQECRQRKHARINVSFPKLQEFTSGFALENLQYRIKHISADKLVLHLKVERDDEPHIAEQFFTRLIENNVNKLQSLQEHEKIPGMSIALRNLNAHCNGQLCIFVEKKYSGFIPAMATTNRVKTEWLKFLQHNANLVSVNLQWLFQDESKSTAFIENTVKALSANAKSVTAEIFVAHDPDNKNIQQQVFAKWGYQLSSQRIKRSFVQQALKSAKFFAFSVTINKASKPDLELLEQELYYLSHHAIHKATHFEERMWDIAAIISLTEITNEVLYRYRLHI